MRIHTQKPSSQLQRWTSSILILKLNFSQIREFLRMSLIYRLMKEKTFRLMFWTCAGK